MTDRLTVGSLFSGIGGIEYGLRLTGRFKTVWQVENDDFCRRLLAERFPDAEQFGDIREVDGEDLEPVDLIAGGFPCQDISIAGKGEGIDGERSGLWSEMWRVIRQLRPRYALVENVPMLRSRGFGRVLGDLAEIGYDAEWESLPASAFGAPHKRDRVFIVAYPNGERGGEGARLSQERESDLPHTNGGGRGGPGAGRQVFPDTFSPGRPQQFSPSIASGPGYDSGSTGGGGGWWESEPAVGRVADGIPDRVDRVRGLGNAVVPQVAEYIGRCIIEAEAE